MKEIDELCSAIDTMKLEEILKEYELALMIIDGAGIAEGLTEKFCNSKALMQAGKRVLIISETEAALRDACNCKVIKVSRKEKSALKRLYGMYEFSDRFRMFSDGSQWGSLLNYVKTGIMTLEEVFQVLLI